MKVEPSTMDLATRQKLFLNGGELIKEIEFLMFLQLIDFFIVIESNYLMNLIS